MSEQTTYCPACKKQVRFTMTRSPQYGGHANVRDTDVVCLDFGQQCTNDVCPLAGLPPIVMGVRLARSGAKTSGWKTVTAVCDACERTAELQVLDENYAFCPLCQSTNRLVMVKLEDESYVAVTGREQRPAE